MKDATRIRSHRLPVLLALAVVLVLAAALGVRAFGPGAGTGSGTPVAAEEPADALSQSPGEPPVAFVPEPERVQVLTLAAPSWYGPGRDRQSIEFQIDLDAIAPLGTGSGNAALWFRQFAKSDGARLAEYTDAMERRIDTGERLGKILPGTDPLLLEAEAWVDQAGMSHYPEVWKLEGYTTAVTNLLAVLTFAKSWVARGNLSDDPDLAREDYLRAIRIGRLLRQEDVVIINDLVGLACIHYGLGALYDLERREGNTEAALLVSLALGEVAPQRLLTSSLITEVDRVQLARGWFAAVNAEVSKDDLDAIINRAQSHPNRRFRAEAILSLHKVARLGSGKARRSAEETLTALADSDDPQTAEMASWCLENQVSPVVLEELES